MSQLEDSSNSASRSRSRTHNVSRDPQSKLQNRGTGTSDKQLQDEFVFYYGYPKQKSCDEEENTSKWNDELPNSSSNTTKKSEREEHRAYHETRKQAPKEKPWRSQDCPTDCVPREAKPLKTKVEMNPKIDSKFQAQGKQSVFSNPMNKKSEEPPHKKFSFSKKIKSLLPNKTPNAVAKVPSPPFEVYETMEQHDQNRSLNMKVAQQEWFEGPVAYKNYSVEFSDTEIRGDGTRKCLRRKEEAISGYVEIEGTHDFCRWSRKEEDVFWGDEVWDECRGTYVLSDGLGKSLVSGPMLGAKFCDHASEALSLKW